MTENNFLVIDYSDYYDSAGGRKPDVIAPNDPKYLKKFSIKETFNYLEDHPKCAIYKIECIYDNS